MRTIVILMLLAAIAANGAVVAADLPGGQYKARRVVKVPPAKIVKDEDSLLSAFERSTPLLLGRQELPGYYGRASSYDYQGPYYGDKRDYSYLFRLPYACGVFGYC